MLPHQVNLCSAMSASAQYDTNCMGNGRVKQTLEGLIQLLSL